MPLTLTPEHSAAIDAAIWKIYRSKLGGGELAQLAKLFARGELLKQLETILAPTLRHGRYYREELEIKLAWIDKRPLAKLANHSKRVELGDAAFFFFEQLANHGVSIPQYGRALIMQAKVAKDMNQIASPSVPVNPVRPSPDSSTARELDLLSKWDTFDLYATSGSRDAIVTGISVAPASLPPAHGWYMATPRRHPAGSQASAWKSPWMCAPAEAGVACAFTLGEVLRSFFAFSYAAPMGNLPIEVGANIDPDPSNLQNPSGQGWERLGVELLRLCPKNQLPRSLFGNVASRSAMGSSVVRSFPYLGLGGNGTGLLSRIYQRLFGRRMPVLVVVFIKTEGDLSNPTSARINRERE